MEHGILLGVIEEGWEALEPAVMRPVPPAVPQRMPAGWLDERRWVKTGLVPKNADALLGVAWTSWSIGRASAEPEQAAVLAADPSTIDAVEAHAREACVRLAPFGCPKVARIVWSIEPAPRVFDYARSVPFRERFDEALGVRAERLAFGERVFDEPPRHPPRDAWRFAWLRRAKRDLTRSNVWLETRSDASANPIAPLLSIWSLGYALAALVDDAIVLAADLPTRSVR